MLNLITKSAGIGLSALAVLGVTALSAAPAVAAPRSAVAASKSAPAARPDFPSLAATYVGLPPQTLDQGCAVGSGSTNRGGKWPTSATLSSLCHAAAKFYQYANFTGHSVTLQPGQGATFTRIYRFWHQKG